MDWNDYDAGDCWDELILGGRPRAELGGFSRFLRELPLPLLRERQQAAELAIRAMGITFTVYEDASNIDRAWPFDLLPRVLTTQEWSRTARGLEQRLRALNLFIADIYGDQKIIEDGVVPRALIEQSPNFRPECAGVQPPFDVWAHVCGSDLVRDADGTMYVLEDNLRVPSGVSYMLENRLLTKRVFGELFRDLDIHPVDGYTDALYHLLASLSPRPGTLPCIAVLTPGVFNSAYFEHAFLAQQIGAELAEGGDLVVGDDDCVYLRTIDGLNRVDVIYRRVDDQWLDPEVFLPDSQLGVPGLMRAWRAGKVAIANAPGSGVADDKAVYAFVPDIIRYYLDAEPLIANVPTWHCDDPGHRALVLDRLDRVVIKPANESGGKGIYVGSHATAAERAEVRERVLASPRTYIAQPIVRLSTAPTLVDGTVAPRHVDLRPFILTGADQYVTNGGLTRVALPAGSLVVNSSQGGGSKDTWILDPTVVPG
jgi:uncharacterized circularly permuted ATP-grasp superfamily protein